VKTKWSPPEGFFKQDAGKIASGLMKESKDQAQAMERLNFYINRAGKNLSAEDKARLEDAKKKLAAMGKDESKESESDGSVEEKGDAEALAEAIGESLINRMVKAMWEAPQFQKLLKANEKYIAKRAGLEDSIRMGVKNALILALVQADASLSGALSGQAKKETRQAVASV